MSSTAQTLVRTAPDRRSLALLVAVALLLLFAGYVVGSGHTGTREVSGPAQVGDRVVTMTVDGTAYGFSESVAWIDAAGAHHDGGWPDCLGSGGEVPRATFGIAPVRYPDGATGDQVVYVDCSR